MYFEGIDVRVVRRFVIVEHQVYGIGGCDQKHNFERRVVTGTGGKCPKNVCPAQCQRRDTEPLQIYFVLTEISCDVDDEI